jgi:hypothetical protein
MPNGILALIISDGRNLEDQNVFGKMDPYVIFLLALVPMFATSGAARLSVGASRTRRGTIATTSIW